MLIEGGVQPLKDLGKFGDDVVLLIALQIEQQLETLALKVLRLVGRHMHRFEDIAPDALCRIIAANQFETPVEDHAPGTQTGKYQVSMPARASAEIINERTAVEIVT